MLTFRQDFEAQHFVVFNCRPLGLLTESCCGSSPARIRCSNHTVARVLWPYTRRTRVTAWFYVHIAVFFEPQGYFSIEVCLLCLSVLSVCSVFMSVVCLSGCLSVCSYGNFQVTVGHGKTVYKTLGLHSTDMLINHFVCLSVGLVVCPSVCLFIPRATFHLTDRMSWEGRLQYDRPSFDKCTGKSTLQQQPVRLHHARLQCNAVFRKCCDQKHWHYDCPSTSRMFTKRMIPYMSL